MTSIDRAIATIKAQGLLDYATKLDSRFAEDQTWTTAQVVALMRSEAERSLTRNTEPTQQRQPLDPFPWVNVEDKRDVYGSLVGAPKAVQSLLRFSPLAAYEQDPSKYPSHVQPRLTHWH